MKNHASSGNRVPSCNTCLRILISCVLASCWGVAKAQPTDDAGTVKLVLQGEIPLTDLIDYVSQRVGTRIVYDETIRSKKVNLVAPDPIPVRSLLQVLQSILLNEGLVITDADEMGFKRITTSDRIPQVARPTRSAADLKDVGSAVPVTQIFVLRETEPTRVAEALRPFLSTTGSNVIPLDRQMLLVVTDVARNVRRAAELIEILDGKQTRVDVKFIAARNVSVATLADQISEILAAQKRARGVTESSQPELQVTIDSRTNSLILIGTPLQIGDAERLLLQLDRTLETRDRTFTLRYYSPERFDEVIREILSERPLAPPYEVRIEGNRLVVSSTPEVLELIARTQSQLDTREAPDTQSPVRFYKIRNVPAQELVETLRDVGGGITGDTTRRRLGSRRMTSNDAAIPGPNVPVLLDPGGAQPVQIPPTPPAVRQRPANADGSSGRIPMLNQQGNADSRFGFDAGFPGELLDEANDRLTRDDAAESPLAQAQVTVDVHTNTIIVVAPAEVQRIYATLIEQLDQRRPQVLLEAQIVIVDVSDGYTLGVEISGGDRTGARRLFSFSSYGLSEVDAATGALSVLPGVGFNGTLVDPSTADVVVRALSNHRRSRVLSAPRILVNDNAEGQLTSVSEVPFTSVNASQTVATTSFAGFAEAGTTITVTPTISEDNYLQLDYIVTLNSFTGPGSEGVPPPRQTNEVRSRVTVPDGHTVIVGGLTSKNDTYEIDSIPWLERIPIIKDIASLQTDNWSTISLFVFLKPVILREDKFKDLKFISETDLEKAQLRSNYPQVHPLLLE